MSACIAVGKACHAGGIWDLSRIDMQAMLRMDDTGALLRFVQRSNDVDLKEGEMVLRARGRYSELVALYQQRGQHEAALDLLHTLTLSPQDLHIPPQGDLAPQ